jgi:hypothetical protein
LVIPPRAIFCTPERLLLEFGVVVKGARSSLIVFVRPGRLLLAFGVLAVVGNGILPTGESGGRGAFPTPITVAYIIMVTEFLNNNKYFSTGNVHRVGQVQGACTPSSSVISILRQLIFEYARQHSSINTVGHHITWHFS